MLRYFASLVDAKRAARYLSIRDDAVTHIDRTPSGLFYISDWFTAQTILSYERGIERIAQHA